MRIYRRMTHIKRKNILLYRRNKWLMSFITKRIRVKANIFNCKFYLSERVRRNMCGFLRLVYMLRYCTARMHCTTIVPGSIKVDSERRPDIVTATHVCVVIQQNLSRTIKKNSTNIHTSHTVHRLLRPPPHISLVFYTPPSSTEKYNLKKKNHTHSYRQAYYTQAYIQANSPYIYTYRHMHFKTH